MNSSALFWQFMQLHVHMCRQTRDCLYHSCAWPKSGNTQEWKYAQDVLALRTFLEEKGIIVTSSTSFLPFPVTSPASPLVWCLSWILLFKNRLCVHLKKPIYLTWICESFQATGNLKAFQKSHCSVTEKIPYCNSKKLFCMSTVIDRKSSLEAPAS